MNKSFLESQLFDSDFSMFCVFYVSWKNISVHTTWTKSLWHCDTIWWHKSGWTLTQAMACCLMVPSHCLNQYWLFINGVQSLLRPVSQEVLKISICKRSLKNTLKIIFTSLRDHWVNSSSVIDISFLFLVLGDNPCFPNSEKHPDVYIFI